MASLAQILKSKSQSIRPSFYTHNKKGVKYPSIRRAFIKNLWLLPRQVDAGKIEYEGHDWALFLDSPDDRLILQDLAFDGYSKCIMSFQEHNNGRYVIVRRQKETKKHG